MAADRRDVVDVEISPNGLPGSLRPPQEVVFAHRSGSSRHRNRTALATLSGPKKLEVLPGATHLFSEPGALDAVIAAAADCFDAYSVRKGLEQ